MKENQGKIITKIIILAVIASILISIMAGFIRSHGWFSIIDWRSDSYSRNSGEVLDEIKSYSVDDISSIEINISTVAVIVNFSDDNDVHIRLYDLNKRTITAGLTNGKLSVDEKGGRWWEHIFRISYNPTIEISIPEKYNESLKANIAAGSIKINESFSLKEMYLDGSAGEIKINSEIECDDFYANITAGEIEIKSLKTKEYNISTQAGQIDISYLEGKGNVMATTGEIKAGIGAIDEYANFEATAGEIKLTVDSSVSFAFTGEKTLGDLKADFDVYTDEKGKYFGQVGDDENTTLSVRVTLGEAKISIK